MTVIREPYFVPETTTLDDQLRQFLRRRSHFALVVDEYGDLQGLVTLEDILEEIVGDISDEHDTAPEAKPIPVRDGSYLVNGAMPVRDLNRELDWKIAGGIGATTVAGLLINEAQMIPERSQVFIYHGFRFEVVDRKSQRITLAEDTKGCRRDRIDCCRGELSGIAVRRQRRCNLPKREFARPTARLRISPQLITH